MKSFIAPIVLVVASIGLFIWFVNPQYSQYGQLRSQSATLDSTLVQAMKLDQIWQNIVNKYNSITPADTQSLNTMLPNSVSTVRLITEVSSVAASKGIVLSTINISNTPSSSGGNVGPNANSYGAIGINLSFTTSYENFLAFLSTLEHSLRLIDVTGITLTPATVGGVSSNDSYTYSLTAQTYYLQ